MNSKRAERKRLVQERATKAAETWNQFDAKVWAECMFGSINKASEMIKEREREYQEGVEGSTPTEYLYRTDKDDGS